MGDRDPRIALPVAPVDAWTQGDHPSFPKGKGCAEPVDGERVLASLVLCRRHSHPSTSLWDTPLSLPHLGLSVAGERGEKLAQLKEWRRHLSHPGERVRLVLAEGRQAWGQERCLQGGAAVGGMLCWVLSANSMGGIGTCGRIDRPAATSRRPTRPAPTSSTSIRRCARGAPPAAARAVACNVLRLDPRGCWMLQRPILGHDTDGPQPNDHAYATKEEMVDVRSRLYFVLPPDKSNTRLREQATLLLA
eukprot:COSAG02_NODE_8756_length_2454_cov_5.012534_2_plen_248_part_00